MKVYRLPKIYVMKKWILLSLLVIMASLQMVAQTSGVIYVDVDDASHVVLTCNNSVVPLENGKNAVEYKTSIASMPSTPKETPLHQYGGSIHHQIPIPHSSRHIIMTIIPTRLQLMNITRTYPRLKYISPMRLLSRRAHIPSAMSL